MKKLVNIVILSSMLLLFNNVFAASVSEIKVEINTFLMLLENETISQEQFDIIAGGALESLDEYKSLKKLFDAGILDYSQFWDSINKILGIEEGNSSSASSSSSGKSEKELLSEAIGSIQSISSDTATKDKLELYETAINNISIIELNHPGSDTAIKLKTNQDIGDFSITKIRKDYLNELLGFYDIVCEKSPSYLCLGFVSLKTGQDMCRTGSGFDELDVAHESLLNAVRIFKGQKTNSAYSNIALASYRSCSKNVPGVSKEWSKGYFAMPLVRTLLDAGDEKTARGIIENVDDPYFKFLSVLAFKVASGETPDLAYSDRLKQFIDEKIEESSFDGLMSRLSLSKMMALHSNSEYSGDDFVTYSYHPGRWGARGEIECGGFVMNYINEEYMDYLFILNKMDKNRYKEYGAFRNDYWYMSTGRKYTDHCNDKHENPHLPNYHPYFYKHTILMLGDLLVFNGLEDANKFREFVIKESDGNSEMLFDYYADLSLANNDNKTVFAPIPNQGDVKVDDIKWHIRTYGRMFKDADGKKVEKNNVDNFSKVRYLENYVSVSYTHLTLPTNREV